MPGETPIQVCSSNQDVVSCDLVCDLVTKIQYRVEVPWLKDRCEKVYSQFGEDGLIAATFEQIGTTNKHCFEVGAGDGRHLSNTRRLVELGWHAMWIENAASKFLQMVADLPENVAAIPEKITPENVNKILSPLPDDMDFGVIDIDGDDYWLWKAMQKRPRVMLVEYEPLSYGHDPDVLPERGEGQAPIKFIVELGIEKGYQLLATTFCNVLFARSDVL